MQRWMVDKDTRKNGEPRRTDFERREARIEAPQDVPLYS